MSAELSSNHRGCAASEKWVKNQVAGIEAIWQRGIGWRRRPMVFVLFDKADVMDALPNNGRVELTVVGKLESGQCIYGTDTVRIIRPRRRVRGLRQR
ncbi:MAG TPA: hypothetical protein HPP87_10265 [Planctomycetes bacterium]|nr:hypothetical protein [Planctomycetota bacterium]